jgi:ankyrin repeat protein
MKKTTTFRAMLSGVVATICFSNEAICDIETESHGKSVKELAAKYSQQPEVGGKSSATAKARPEPVGALELHEAAAENDVAKITKLLAAKADPNAIDDKGKTPLHCVKPGATGSVEATEALLKAGADPNRKSADGLLPIHRAALGRNVEVVASLLKRGADPNAAFPWDAKGLAERVGGGGDPNSADTTGITVLHFAAQEGNDELLTILLEAGANVNAIDTKGETALHYAAKSNEGAKCMAKLIGAGAIIYDRYSKDKAKHDMALTPRIVEITLLKKNTEDIKKILESNYPIVAANPVVQALLKARIAAPPKTGIQKNAPLIGAGNYATGSELKVKGAGEAYDLVADLASNIIAILIQQHNVLDSPASRKKFLEVLGEIRRAIQSNAAGDESAFFFGWPGWKESREAAEDTNEDFMIEDCVLDKPTKELRGFFNDLDKSTSELIEKSGPKEPGERDLKRRSSAKTVWNFNERPGENYSDGRKLAFMADSGEELIAVRIEHRKHSKDAIAYHLSPLQEAWGATSEDELRDKLLKFIHRMSCSSVYNRGQAAITLWIVRGLARAKKYELKLAGRWAPESAGYKYDVCALLTLGEDEFVEKYRNEIQLVKK